MFVSLLFILRKMLCLSLLIVVSIHFRCGFTVHMPLPSIRLPLTINNAFSNIKFSPSKKKIKSQIIASILPIWRKTNKQSLNNQSISVPNEATEIDYNEINESLDSSEIYLLKQLVDYKAGIDYINGKVVSSSANNTIIAKNPTLYWHYSGIVLNPNTGKEIVGIEGIEAVTRLTSTQVNKVISKYNLYNHNNHNNLVNKNQQINQPKSVEQTKGKDHLSTAFFDFITKSRLTTTINRNLEKIKLKNIWKPLQNILNSKHKASIIVQSEGYLSTKVFMYVNKLNHSEPLTKFRVTPVAPLRSIKPVNIIHEVIILQNNKKPISISSSSSNSHSGSNSNSNSNLKKRQISKTNEIESNNGYNNINHNNLIINSTVIWPHGRKLSNKKLNIYHTNQDINNPTAYLNRPFLHNFIQKVMNPSSSSSNNNNNNNNNNNWLLPSSISNKNLNSIEMSNYMQGGRAKPKINKWISFASPLSERAGRSQEYYTFTCLRPTPNKFSQSSSLSTRESQNVVKSSFNTKQTNNNNINNKLSNKLLKSTINQNNTQIEGKIRRSSKLIKTKPTSSSNTPQEPLSATSQQQPLRRNRKTDSTATVKIRVPTTVTVKPTHQVKYRRYGKL